VLYNFFRMFVVLFSLIFPTFELLTNLYFWIFSLLLFLSVLVSNSILPKVFILFSILYSMSFLKQDVIPYLLVILLGIFIRRNGVTNKWISYILYIFCVALFNHALTPVFFIIFTVLNFPEFVSMFKDKKLDKRLGLMLVFILIFISIPFPDFRLDIIRIIQSKEGPSNKLSIEKRYSKELSISNSTSNGSVIQPSEKPGATNTSVLEQKVNEISKIARTKMFKILQTILMLSIVVSLFYVLTVAAKAPKETRGSLLTSFGVTIVVLLFFLFVLAPTIFEMINHVRNGQMLSESVENSKSNIEQDSQSITKHLSNNVGSGSTTGSRNNSMDFMIFLFQLASSISGIIAILFLGKMYYKLLTKRQEQQDEKQVETVSDSTVYKANYSYDEIMELSGTDCVYHAYHYIRQNIFKDFDSLTPHELLEKFNIPELYGLSEKYVEVTYAFKKDIRDSEVKYLKEEFVKLIEKRYDIFEYLKT